VRDQEDEKNAFSAMTSAGLPLDKQLSGNQTSTGPPVITQGLRASEYVNFKMPKDLNLMYRDGIHVLCYSKPGVYEQNQAEMLFKMVKADAKLVKAVYETNGFG
jgi:hypothetical protein